VPDQPDTDYKLWWHACDILRTACINSFYYQQRLWWANFWYLSFEITIAIGATRAALPPGRYGRTGLALFYGRLYQASPL
jgi:hypothetical protein